MRTNISIVVTVFILIVGMGSVLASSIAWLRHSQPVVSTKTVTSEDLDVETLKKKKWLKFDPAKNYFYQQQVEVKTIRGTFPFLREVETPITASELWECKRH